MESIGATVSVVVVTYRSEGFVGEVLEALTNQRPVPDEVIVVDNASPDGTRAVLQRFDVHRVDLDENTGFTGGCHAGAAAATGEVLVFLGHDSVPEPGWLTPLVEAARRPDVGAAMATLVDADDPTRFNTSGGHLGYTGLAWVSDLGEPVPPGEPPLVDVAFPSGSAMAIRTAEWRRFGGFRPDLFMYLEDTDLGWRLRLAGLRVVRATGSRVRHRYDFGRTADKMYWLERNRWMLLAANYRGFTKLVLSPALLLAELGIIVVSVRDRWFPIKLRAMRDASRERSSRRAAAAMVRSQRILGDAAMIASMDAAIGTVRQVRTPRGSGLVDAILRGWRGVAVRLIALVERRS